MTRLEGTHFDDEELILFFYGEACDAAGIDIHLSLCRECRERYEALKVTMNAVSSWSVPDREPDYGQQVWRELVRRDASIGRRLPWWKFWVVPRKLAAAGAMAALLAVAFIAGRVSHSPDSYGPVPAAVISERLLAAALTDHLEQSERTLIEITNSAAGPSLDISSEQQRAESLLSGNRLYRQAAERDGRTNIAGVLDDLERVLLDIARAPSALPASDLEKLRKRVEDQELLFRLRVLGMRLQELQNQPVRPQVQKEI